MNTTSSQSIHIGQSQEVVAVEVRGAVVRRVRVPDRICRRVVMRRTDRIDQAEVGIIIGALKVIIVG